MLQLKRAQSTERTHTHTHTCETHLISWPDEHGALVLSAVQGIRSDLTGLVGDDGALLTHQDLAGLQIESECGSACCVHTRVYMCVCVRVCCVHLCACACARGHAHTHITVQ